MLDPVVVASQVVRTAGIRLGRAEERFPPIVTFRLDASADFHVVIEKVWSRVDADTSGAVDMHELNSLMRDFAAKSSVDFSESDVAEIFNRFDKDGNRVLDKGEFEECMQTLFAKILIVEVPPTSG